MAIAADSRGIMLKAPANAITAGMNDVLKTTIDLLPHGELGEATEDEST